jgi:hypothetical protein
MRGAQRTRREREVKARRRRGKSESVYVSKKLFTDGKIIAMEMKRSYLGIE